jgi:hypothetical protein
LSIRHFKLIGLIGPRAAGERAMEGNIVIAVIVWLKLAVVIMLIDPDDDNVIYVRVCTGAIIVFFVNNGAYFEL